MTGIWKTNDGERLDKYLVVRRDNTVPPWPWFVLAAADPVAPIAIRAYADAASANSVDDEDFITDLYALADEFDRWRASNTTGDPAGARHRTDDPVVVARIERRS